MDGKGQELTLGERVDAAFAKAKELCADRVELPKTLAPKPGSDWSLLRELEQCDAYIAAVNGVRGTHGPVDELLDMEGRGNQVFSAAALFAGVAGIYEGITSNSAHFYQTAGATLVFLSEGLHDFMPRRTVRYSALAAAYAIFAEATPHYLECPALSNSVAVAAVTSVALIVGHWADRIWGLRHPSVAKRKRESLEMLAEAKGLLESLKQHSQKTRRKLRYQRSGEQSIDSPPEGYSIRQVAIEIPTPTEGNKSGQSPSESMIEALLPSGDQLTPVAEAKEVAADLAVKTPRELKIYNKLVFEYEANGPAVDSLIKQEGADVLIKKLTSLKDAVPQECYRALARRHPEVLAQPAPYFVALERLAGSIARIPGSDYERKKWLRKLEDQTSVPAIESLDKELSAYLAQNGKGPHANSKPSTAK